jgi:FkbM family methyltransferase
MSVLGEVFHNLCTVLTEDPVVQLPEYKGVFALDCRSDMFKRIIANGEYESELALQCLSQVDPARDAIDVGANAGLYTVLLAKTLRKGRVLAVEPVPNAAARLRRNISLNHVLDKVIVFEGAASDRTGSAQVKTIEGREDYSTMGEMAHPAVTAERYRTLDVRTSTIDDLVRGNSLDPGFIKVDVEGCEHLVFLGAGEVLKKHRPVVLSELSDYLLRKNGSSAREVIALIANHGYQVIDPLDPPTPPGEKEFGDILCIPR